MEGFSSFWKAWAHKLGVEPSRSSNDPSLPSDTYMATNLQSVTLAEPNNMAAVELRCAALLIDTDGCPSLWCRYIVSFGPPSVTCVVFALCSGQPYCAFGPRVIYCSSPADVSEPP